MHGVQRRIQLAQYHLHGARRALLLRTLSDARGDAPMMLVSACRQQCSLYSMVVHVHGVFILGEKRGARAISREGVVKVGEAAGRLHALARGGIDI